MSDYFDLIEHELRLAVRRRAHLPWHARLRLHRSRALLIACGVVAVGGPAIAAAAGAFQPGSPVPATVPATPRAFGGVAIASSVRVLSLRFADPGGGPPWALRIDRTTRGLLCVQPGRVVNGEVGVLGVDDAFSNDNRFHPFSADYVDPFGCAGIDGAGHAFVAPSVADLPASALQQSCEPSYVSRSPGGPAREVAVRRGPICPHGALRNVSYGMLGPDAVSYTYATADGRLVTAPTAGADGAFLVVDRAPDNCPSRTHTYGGRHFVSTYCDATLIGSDPAPGQMIRRVTYRSGRTCSLPAHFTAGLHADRCPSVGYVPSPSQTLTAAQVAAPVSVRQLGLQHICIRGRGDAPCGAHPPKSAHLAPGAPYFILDVRFRARVAVANVGSNYTIYVFFPPVHNAACQIGGSVGPTTVDLRAGQYVDYPEAIPRACRGPFRVRVSFRRAGAKGLEVGQATFTLPPAGGP